MIDRIELRTQELGEVLLSGMRRGSAPWRPAGWEDRLMAWSLDDPEFKVQLFRFVDVLPMLTGDAEVRRHFLEYLDEAGAHVPGWLSGPLRLAPSGGLSDRVLAGLARFSAMRMAGRFIAGSTPSEAASTVLGLRKRKLAFTADLLGEAVISEAEAEAYQSTCIELVRGLARELARAPEVAQIDRSGDRALPRVNLSLKLTSLTARFDPLHAETTTERVLARLRPILRVARAEGAHVHVDMEQYAYKDLTFAIFRQVMMEPEFRDWSDVGIVAQAYLRETEGDLNGLLEWVEERGTPIVIRLVKGAYWDYEVLFAGQMGWPIPVFTRKFESDHAYEQCADLLMRNHRRLVPAIASHNARSLARAMALAEAYHVPSDGFELQVLNGMAGPLQEALARMGRRVRVYTPYGAMLPGMAYLVRRLLENTSNDSFLKASLARGGSAASLLRDPGEEVAMLWSRKAEKAKSTAAAPGPFANEPGTDFHKEANRDRMRKALAEVRARLGGSYPLVIDGAAITTGETIVSTNPGDHAEVIGTVACADESHVDRALAVCVEGRRAWSEVDVEERSAALVRAAAAIRARHLEFAAWIILEAGKTWREADIEVGEAIDFCEFYAREMLRMTQPRRRDVPGETNELARMARGVAVVIPPWNFPLAIPLGMTAAALVTGNTVVLKPAEQTPVLGALIVEVLHQVGVPKSALQYLPGRGEVAGRALVRDKRVDVVAFTGSMAVGLEINRSAAETPDGQSHVKRVIAEMGGKNALIIDDDADLDEAVVGVMTGAFGYSGQKCSACSRVIVLERVYDTFVKRLAEAARTLTIGPADDPDTIVSPLIDADAVARLREYAAIAEREGRVALKLDPGGLAERGNFVGPMIVADVDRNARIAQEEIFGPLLSVIKAADLDDALEIALGVPYALTGGLYSRSPANIARVRRDFKVGNLYINRGITGAYVDRQPFGGFKLSGIGTKAGGPDYLLEFMLSRSISENTMRRGFAPEPEGEMDQGAQRAKAGEASAAPEYAAR